MLLDNVHPGPLLPEVGIHTYVVRVNLQKETSIFKDIVQIGGREVNPISKN